MITIYKPNKKGTGAALQFKYQRDNKGQFAIYAKIINEDEGRFKDNFRDPDQNVSVKLSMQEAGQVLNTFKKLIEFKAYHSTDRASVQINLAHSEKNGNSGFWLNIVRNKDQKFKMGIYPGEAVVLENYIQTALSIHFQHVIELDEQYRENSQNNSGNEKREYSNKEPKNTPKKETTSNEDGNPFEAETEEEDDDVPF